MSEREKLPIERNWAFNNPEVRAKAKATRDATIAAKKQAIADGTWVEPPKPPDKRKRKHTILENAIQSKKSRQRMRKEKGIVQVLVNPEQLERTFMAEAEKVLGTLPRVQADAHNTSIATLLKGADIGTPLGPLGFGPPPLQDGYHNIAATDTQSPVTPSENPHLPALREMLEVVQGFDPDKDVFMTGADFQLILKALLYALGDV